MSKRTNQNNFKEQQYCRQVERVTESVLCEIEWGEEQEINCWVHQVLPNPNASRLLVLLGVDWKPDFSPANYLETLRENIDLFKEEIAISCNRKKIPHLEFSFVPSQQMF